MGGSVALVAAGALQKPVGAEEVAATGKATFGWLPMEEGPDAEDVFKEIEASKEWSLDFIAYLSRILLNYDERSAQWWKNEVLPSVPAEASPKERGHLLRSRFGDFQGSVEFGLRKYLPEGRRRSGILKRLVDRYGKTEESRRQFALAFTLLEDQPLELIALLLNSLDARSRIQAVFSPALTDYLAMDPTRLLPYTQYPVWEAKERRWVVPGLRAAMPREDQGGAFGRRGDAIVVKERPLGFNDYGLFAISGALGCSFTHSLVIPLDVVKTRAQTNPGATKGNLVAGAIQLAKEEGVDSLFLGWEPTVLGYLWYGVTVYPGYEFFKRFLFSLVGPAVVEGIRVPLVLLAGALATVVACFGVCPAEACRIRMVADECFRGRGLAEVVDAIARKDGFGYFYDGLSTIMVRQVLFGMMKFLVFDFFADFLFDVFPVLSEQIATQLCVSLVSGAVAGVASSIVSQPADTVLSRMNKAGGRSTFFEVGSQIYAEEGLPGFFAGLGSRCVWAGCIISGQFTLYDICKAAFGVKDLRMFLDVQL